MNSSHKLIEVSKQEYNFGLPRIFSLYERFHSHIRCFICENCQLHCETNMNSKYYTVGTIFDINLSCDQNIIKQIIK